MFIPRVVEELAKVDDLGNNASSMSKEDLHRQAQDCKRIYEMELGSVDDEREKKSKTNEQQRTRKIGKTKSISVGEAAAYDSDDTVEMTEEEIDLAYKNLASTMCKN